ncbi:MAG: recombinase family protein, partial [Dehalococcoidia bacterium]
MTEHQNSPSKNSQCRLAAIWWRVSTDDQREISPETQILEAKALAEAEGYDVPDEYVIGTDWASLSVWESPPMDRLKELIRHGHVQAVFMYEADRAPSKPAHRLLFRASCEQFGVTIRCRYGQVPAGEMSEVMEFLSAWQKERQVLRAQQGATDGLRHRVKVRGLPASLKAPYG